MGRSIMSPLNVNRGVWVMDVQSTKTWFEGFGDSPSCWAVSPIWKRPYQRIFGRIFHQTSSKSLVTHHFSTLIDFNRSPSTLQKRQDHGPPGTSQIWQKHKTPSQNFQSSRRNCKGKKVQSKAVWRYLASFQHPTKYLFLVSSHKIYEHNQKRLMNPSVF